jgi:endonuclease YncB( thermonuclease family)
VGVAAVAIAATVGLAWFATGGNKGLTTVASQLPLLGGARPLEGRARAVSGDQLRIGETTVRLAGIEAPVPQARCGGNRRCGTAAEEALGRLVNGRTVTCKLSGTDAAGRQLGTCLRGDADIGAELVRKGHVFAAGGLFSAYASLEREARNAKAGIWAGGDPERPAEYRARAAGKRSS